MEYSLISKYRAQLMGMAMILIIIFHLSVKSIGFIDQMKNICDFGVNLFFFLSGYSMYYAWLKNPNVSNFWKKRISRIFVTFLPIVIIWCLPQFLIGRISIWELIGKCSTVYFWYNGNLLYWFVSGLVVLYFVTPVWLKIFDRQPKIMVFATVLIYVLLVYLARVTDLSHNKCFIDRALVYFMGLIIGRKAYNNCKVTKKESVFIILFVLSGILVFAMSGYDFNNYDYKYIVELFFTVPVILILVKMFDITKGIYSFKILIFCGNITLECYLLHERILFVLGAITDKINIRLDPYLIVINILAIIITIIVAKVYKLMIGHIYMNEAKSQLKKSFGL